MNNNIQTLLKEFDRISKMGWVKTLYKGSGGGGRTFEHLLGNEKNDLEIPDYGDIELKVRSAAVNKYIRMFNSSPDGTYMFETKRILNKYGYPDKLMKQNKVFNTSISATEYTIIGHRHYMKLKINRTERKIFLCIYDKNNNLTDNKTFWTFELLEEKLLRKEQTLAIIDASYNKEWNDVYYKYKHISFYKLKKFDYFIDAVEKGYIIVTFSISIYRNGKRCGQPYDHGTSFGIEYQHINELYDTIDI